MQCESFARRCPPRSWSQTGTVIITLFASEVGIRSDNDRLVCFCLLIAVRRQSGVIYFQENQIK